MGDHVGAYDLRTPDIQHLLCLKANFVQVEGLRRDMHRSGGSGVTIVHGSNG